MEKTEVWRWNWTKPGFFPEIEEEENTNWEKESEKAPNWARLRWRWKFSPSSEKVRGKKENRKEEFLFFTFFTFLGNPPPKNLQIQNAAVTPWTPHHCAPHTMLYSGGGFIMIGWVWREWLVTMDTKIISLTNFKAILRPLHPTSQDKTHTTMLPRRCPTRPYEYHGS